MTPNDAPPITEGEAVAIAAADATAVYGDLNRFKLEVSYRNERWLVHYRFIPQQRLHTGGGPRYVINAFDGSILWKLYGQ